MPPPALHLLVVGRAVGTLLVPSSAPWYDGAGLFNSGKQFAATSDSL